MAQNNAKSLRQELQNSHSNPTRLQTRTVLRSSSMKNHLHCISPCRKPDSNILRMRIQPQWMYSESHETGRFKSDWIGPIALVLILTHISKYTILRIVYQYIEILTLPGFSNQTSAAILRSTKALTWNKQWSDAHSMPVLVVSTLPTGQTTVLSA